MNSGTIIAVINVACAVIVTVVSLARTLRGPVSRQDFKKLDATVSQLEKRTQDLVRRDELAEQRGDIDRLEQRVHTSTGEIYTELRNHASGCQYVFRDIEQRVSRIEGKIA